MLTLVSAYFTRTSENHYRSDDDYWSYFYQLMEAQIPILVFLDPAAYIRWSAWSGLPSYSHVKAVPIPPLDTSWLPQDLQLPQERNDAKDTKEYLCIQLLKLFFLQDARARTETEYLAWVDFGAFHMISDPCLARDRLRRLCIRAFRRDKLIAPGCPGWANPDMSQLWDKVCWKFCGSFLLGHRDLFATAYNKQMDLVRRQLPRLTWEVNYWVMMDEVEPLFTRYLSNHSDQIFDLPPYPSWAVDGIGTDPEIIELVRPFTSVSEQRIQNVLAAVQNCVEENVPGDFIEIGVWKGGLLMAMAMKCQQLGVQRIIRGYDTFSGMTDPQDSDVDAWGRRAADMFEEIRCLSSLEEVQSNLSLVSYPLFALHKGDITQTRLTDIPDCIALLRLDTDWYESTRFELEHFTPRVSEYGYVIVDDYGHWRGARRAVDEYRPFPLHAIDYTGVWWRIDYGRRDLERLVNENPDNEWLRVFSQHFEHFVALHRVLERRFVQGCGSYLFDGQDYRYQKETWKKQDALFRAGKRSTRALEIGVYIGHSLFILLLSNPSLVIDCIDIDEDLSPKAVDYLNQTFGNRIRYSPGAADLVLQEWTIATPPGGDRSYDLVHIDADHNVPAVVRQFRACEKWVEPGALFVFDDYEAVQSCIDDWIDRGPLQHLETPGGLWTNIVAAYKRRNKQA